MAEGKPTKAAPAPKGVKLGVVDSLSGSKTVRVVVSDRARHRLYGKYLRRRSRLLVHDPKQEAQLGDTVAVVQCRPVSKHKSWRLLRVVRRTPTA
ncbi:MAG: hypothetical protein AMJ81_07495 [Phycisphaerae bacterium SM23_33]|jgi:small subunit ribosomal protein S17|nr:MAG: hypothetical protein AMJ81_07495 [Phycisphaerae bacterium SM23_33]